MFRIRINNLRDQCILGSRQISTPASNNTQERSLLSSSHPIIIPYSPSQHMPDPAVQAALSTPSSGVRRIIDVQERPSKGFRSLWGGTGREKKVVWEEDVMSGAGRWNQWVGGMMASDITGWFSPKLIDIPPTAIYYNPPRPNRLRYLMDDTLRAS